MPTPQRRSYEFKNSNISSLRLTLFVSHLPFSIFLAEFSYLRRFTCTRHFYLTTLSFNHPSYYYFLQHFPLSLTLLPFFSTPLFSTNTTLSTFSPLFLSSLSPISLFLLSLLLSPFYFLLSFSTPLTFLSSFIHSTTFSFLSLSLFFNHHFYNFLLSLFYSTFLFFFFLSLLFLPLFSNLFYLFSSLSLLLFFLFSSFLPSFLSFFPLK